METHSAIEVTGAVGLVLSLLGWAFSAGLLTERVNALKERVDHLAGLVEKLIAGGKAP